MTCGPGDMYWEAEAWLKSQKEATEPLNRGSALRGFFAAWKARLESAIRAEGMNKDADITVILAEMEHLKAEADRAWNRGHDAYDRYFHLRRTHNALLDGIRAKGEIDLDDVPLYRRISNQRRELAVANATITALKEQIEILAANTRETGA